MNIELAGDPQIEVVGLDEAGKGDYFGPLVVAAVAGPPGALARLGVADSKRISDGRVRKLALTIRDHFPVEIVAVHPPKYNELYRRMKNLNRLLAWCHASALENILARVAAHRVIADQFAAPEVLKSALKARGRSVDLVQAHRAETHPVVAAASIVARAEFLDRLESLARQFDVQLPKGAGATVDAAGRVVLQRGGIALLAQVSKLHFKTTQKIGIRAQDIA